jgi:hypothetical protein
MSYQLKSIPPKTQLDTYTQGQQINFDLSQDMDAIVAGSLYVTFQVQVNQGAGALDTNIFLDPKVGVASFFENFNTQCALFQEVITNYARLHKMLNTLQYSNDALTCGLRNTTELLVGDKSHCNAIIRESSTYAFGVCHRPYIALNNMTGDLDFQKSGKISVSWKLPSYQKIFYGSYLGANVPSYTIRNIELHYKTVPQGSPAVQIRVVEDVQKLIQSSNTTVSNTFTNPIDSVLVSFSTVTSETTVSENSLICQNPNIYKMMWNWNDQSNRLVSYEIESIEEQVLSAYSVLNTVSNGFELKNKVYLSTQDAVNCETDNFLVGLNIGSLVNFSNSGLGLNVRINNLSEEYYAHMYGFGEKQIV